MLHTFKIRNFRAATLGYFGHMWELYTFWTIVPLIVANTALSERFPVLGVSGLSFCIIAVGALGSLLGGVVSQRVGSAKVALAALALSGVCGLIFALGWRDLPVWALATLMLIWGAAVVADSRSSPHWPPKPARQNRWAVRWQSRTASASRSPLCPLP